MQFAQANAQPLLFAFIQGFKGELVPLLGAFAMILRKVRRTGETNEV